MMHAQSPEALDGDRAVSAVTSSQHGTGSSDALADLLRQCRDFSCEFGHCLANHLPMMLVGLARMGASERRLRACFERYRDANALGPPPPLRGTISGRNWTTHLGERDREADFRAYFASQVRASGSEAVQRLALPVLLPGVAASALHALMRLAYANMIGSDAEIATSLGYWAATYLHLATPGGANPDTLDPAEILRRLSLHRELLDIQPETDLLWHAMRAVGRTPAFAVIADGLATNESSLERFAAASLALFAGAFDFCSLHALTGTHWLRLIGPSVADRPLLLRHYWRAIAAVYPKMGMPPLPSAETLETMRTAACPPWPEITAAAIASDDEHDVSLVFSAREEERVYGDPLYRRVAARRMGLIAA